MYVLYDVWDAQQPAILNAEKCLQAGVAFVRVLYVCKHCDHLIGELNRPDWTYAEVEQFCGLNHLTPSERFESVSYPVSGVMRVRSVCDDCQRAVEANPEILLEGKLLQ
jgi:hypothetical protein